MRDGNDNTDFSQFLEEFCKNHQAPVTEQKALPFRVCVTHMTEAEIEGECLDWMIQFLHTVKCPLGLDQALVRAAVDGLLKADLSNCLEEDEEELQPDNKENTAADNRESEAAKEEEIKVKRYLASKVLRHACTNLYEVCEKWRGSPPTLPTGGQIFDVSVHAIKNSRRKMEDRHVVFSNANIIFGLKDQPQCSIFGVFDGHGGVDAAHYAAAHLCGNVAKQRSFPNNIQEALHQGFRQTDKNFHQKAKLDKLSCGSTGVTVVVQDNKLYVAWVGDSQALLVRDGKPVHIMTAHKPEREDEKERIERLGGCVVWFGAWRVNGTLSVSRSIGDIAYKPYVSGEPDVNCFELDGTEDYIVLACDGLWDQITNDDLVALVSEHQKENNGDRSMVAHKLVKTAKENGSHDNISVVVVFFNRDDEPTNRAGAEEISEKVKQNEEEGTKKEHKADTNKQNNSPFKMSDSEKKDESNKDSSKDSTDSSNQHSSFSGNLSSQVRNISKSDSQKPVMSAGSLTESGSTNQSMEHALANQSPVSMSSENPSPGNNASEDDSQGIGSQSAENISPDNASPEKASIHSFQSDTSNTELALMSKTASRCINNRKAKRSKNGRNGRGKQNAKGTTRGRLGTTALMTYTSRCVPPRSRSAESNLSLAQKSMLRSGDQIFEMITGCSPHVIRKAKSPVGKWTVAVEMEGASAMFDDVSTLQEQARRKSDTHFYHKNK